jgi:predicted transcriptional regulator
MRRRHIIRRESMAAKQTVRDLLDRLPDDCSLEDVLYHLYVVQEIERGLGDAAAGRTIPHEQVVRELRRKWSIGAAG